MLSLGGNKKKTTQNRGCSIVAGSHGVANQLLHGAERRHPCFAHFARFIAVFITGCLPSVSKGAARLRMIPKFTLLLMLVQSCCDILLEKPAARGSPAKPAFVGFKKNNL